MNGYVRLDRVLKEAAVGTVAVGGVTYGVYLIAESQESSLMGALASWHVTWGGGEDLDRLQKTLLGSKPPMGWLPEPKDDPLLRKIASLARQQS